MVLQLCFVQTFPARKYQGLLLIIKMGCRAEHQCFERSPFQRGGSSLMVSVEQNAEIGIREIPGQSAGDSSFREQTKTGRLLFILRKTAVDKFRTGRATSLGPETY